MREQARTAWAKIAAILEAGKQSLADVVRVVEYVTPEGIERYAEAAAVRGELFGDNRPALSTVVVNRLLRPQALIEIEVEAERAPSAAAARRARMASRVGAGASGRRVGLSFFDPAARRRGCGDSAGRSGRADAHNIQTRRERAGRAWSGDGSRGQDRRLSDARGVAELPTHGRRAPRIPRTGLSRRDRNNNEARGPSRRA